MQKTKKELLFLITALSFDFNWSVEWKLVKATGTAQRNKANDCSETFLLLVKLKNYTIADVVLFEKKLYLITLLKETV
jgi:hypothetical protein